MNDQIEKIRQALINAMAGEVQPREIREGLEALEKVEKYLSNYSLPDGSSIIFEREE